MDSWFVYCNVVILIATGFFTNLVWWRVRKKMSAEDAERIHELETRLLPTANLAIRLGIYSLAIWTLCRMAGWFVKELQLK
jgi:hypothetical protein